MNISYLGASFQNSGKYNDAITAYKKAIDIEDAYRRASRVLSPDVSRTYAEYLAADMADADAVSKYVGNINRPQKIYNAPPQNRLIETLRISGSPPEPEQVITPASAMPAHGTQLRAGGPASRRCWIRP